METITIPYNDYKALMEERTNFVAIQREIEYLMNNSKLNYRKDGLTIEEHDFIVFIEKYYPLSYKKKLNELLESEDK